MLRACHFVSEANLCHNQHLYCNFSHSFYSYLPSYVTIVTTTATTTMGRVAECIFNYIQCLLHSIFNIRFCCKNKFDARMQITRNAKNLSCFSPERFFFKNFVLLNKFLAFASRLQFACTTFLVYAFIYFSFVN